MGSTLGRIEREFILQKMEEEHLQVELHGDRKIGRGNVLAVTDNNALVLQLQQEPEEPFLKGSRVRLFFSFFDHTMTFEGRIEEAGKELTVSIPDTVVKNLERKFERVPPPDGDIRLSFDLESSKIELDFPKARTYRGDGGEGTLIYSSRFDGDTLQDLLGQFNGVINSYADSSRIVMFRERKPMGFQETVCSSSGKALLIPDTSGYFPTMDEAEGRNIVVSEQLPEDDQLDEHFYGKSASELRSWLVDLGREGVRSELTMPICYREYIIGVIQLRCGIASQSNITLEAYDVCNEFASVLVHVLESKGYFAGGRHSHTSWEPQIIDISASGILFTHPSTELSSQIGIYSDLELSLTIQGRPMKISGRIMRKYHDGNHFLYGIQFMEMKPEDFRYLFEAVYGRNFTERDDRLWEGGAKPPEVQL